MTDAPSQIVELVYRHGTEIVSLALIGAAIIVALFGIAGVFDVPQRPKR